MNFEYTSPEQVGISSGKIQEYIEILEKNSIVTHNLIIMRYGKIIFEHYWEPFHREFKHRMYSVTKSFVALAIGFLEQEGKINLDDALEQYFPKESANSHEYQKKQTIRDTLMMAAAMPNTSWQTDKPADRVQHYFDRHNPGAKPPGTIFNYDSEGSFVLGALVERVSGMKLMDYLKLQLFDKIGVGQMDCLTCPGGHSWSDSGLICRPIDLLRVAQFCINKGEGILNEDYITAATSKQIEVNGFYVHQDSGYGYLIWRNLDNSFSFNGMGSQYAICIPEKDIVMVYNGDNQGVPNADSIILSNFFELISRPAGEPLPPAMPVNTHGLKLYAVKGKRHVELEKKINGVKFQMENNPMGITELSLNFEQDSGILRYINAQGEKELPFGLCENVFGAFPQSGYPDRVGSQSGNRLYDCATSAAWISENDLIIKVQIIDTYFGSLSIHMCFKGKEIALIMRKEAEHFLKEYSGFAGGTQEKE